MDELRERRARMIETLLRAEEQARKPEDAARYRGMRRMVEQNETHRLKTEAGLLPCPACREWGDLGTGCCLECGAAVDWEAVRWTTGTWQVDLVFLLLFGAVTGVLSWLILALEGWLVLKLAAGLLLVPAGWLTYLNALRMGRLLAWKLRQRGS